MSTIAPNSEIWLIKAPIESDNLNHLNFANQQAQLNYFQNLPHIKLEKYTYIRQDGSMQVEGNADNLMRYNYMLYKNTAYGNKWIFAFITNVEFLANDVSRVSFRTDVFNTWYFDVEFKTTSVNVGAVAGNLYATSGKTTLVDGCYMVGYREETSTDTATIGIYGYKNGQGTITTTNNSEYTEE